MRVFKSRDFTKWAEKENLPDSSLLKSIEEMNKGLIDAWLGGTIVKKRVALANQGKSGGFRTIIAFKLKDKAFIK